MLNHRHPFITTFYGQNPFPEGTQGFLYYRLPKDGAPPTASELRFRVTPTNDPASFAQGSDLLHPNGLPWGIPLLAMVANLGAVPAKKYQPIKALLIDTGLVTPDFLDMCATMVDGTNRNLPQRHSRIIHSLGQPFHINLDAIHFDFYILSRDQLEHRRWNSFFHEKLTSFKYNLPYSGGYITFAYLMPILLS
jgi:hypothetical protein